MNYRSIAIQSNQATFYIYPVSKHGWLAGNPRIRHLNGNINISYATWGTVHCHRLDSQRLATFWFNPHEPWFTSSIPTEGCGITCGVDQLHMGHGWPWYGYE